MRSDWGTRKAALIALAATLVLFAEYLPPLTRVAIPYDLAEYHYPLMDYAHLALKTWRIPLWDSAIYSGIPYAGNTQTALFYPPSWLLYIANLSRPHLRYASLEIFVILPVWLAFVLAFC